MKNYSIVAVLLVIAGLVVFADNNGKKYGQNDVVVTKVVTQTAPMYHHDDVYDLTRGEDVGEGAFAKLTRTEAGLGIYMKTKDLPAGAYTAWLLIYNTSEGCVDGCNLEDVLGNPEATPGAVRIGHDYIANDGNHMTLNAWVPAGEFVEDEGNLLLPGSAFGGLENPMTAEVHIILKWHGTALNNGSIDQEILDAQLHSLEGGCREHRLLDDMYINGVDGPKMPVILLDDGFELCPDPQGATFKNPFSKK